MQYFWKERQDAQIPRDPEVHFKLTALAPDLVAEIGLDPEEDLDRVFWVALIGLTTGTKTPFLPIKELISKAADYRENGTSFADDLVIPAEYTEEDREAGQLSQITVFARRQYLLTANYEGTGEDTLGVRSLSVGNPIPPDQIEGEDVRLFPMNDDKEYVPEGSVVMAVIDNGMAIGHNLFRVPDPSDDTLSTTRLYHFWNMDGPKGGNGVPAEYGEKWTKAMIDQRLADNMQAGLLHEQGFYRDIGLIDFERIKFDPCAQRASHGTHVTALAAGYDSQDPAEAAKAHKRPIIAVNLPMQGVRNTSGEQVFQLVPLALQYIRRMYKRFRIEGDDARRPPLVINFSFGNYAGPHDSRDRFSVILGEQVDLFEQNAGITPALCLPAGNSNLQRIHAVLSFTDTNDTSGVDWLVHPADRSPSELQVWLNWNSPALGAFEFSVEPPVSVDPGTVRSGGGPAYFDLIDPQDRVVAQLGYNPPQKSTDRGMFSLMALPTETLYAGRPVVPPGIWGLTLKRSGGSGETQARAWIKRDETLPGFPQYGRQSRFEDPDYVRFLRPGQAKHPAEDAAPGGEKAYDPAHPAGPVRRAGTLNGFASGSLAVVAGGWVRSNRKMAGYSSSGPTQNLGRKGPDAALVSEDSVAMKGVLSAGSHSGSMVAMSGTSMAAPQAARWLADNWPDDGEYRDAIFDAAKDDDDADPPPQTRAGGGRMVTENLFGKLRWPGQ